MEEGEGRRWLLEERENEEDKLEGRIARTNNILLSSLKVAGLLWKEGRRV